jgi:hypothetical protein
MRRSSSEKDTLAVRHLPRVLLAASERDRPTHPAVECLPHLFQGIHFLYCTAINKERTFFE